MLKLRLIAAALTTWLTVALPSTAWSAVYTWTGGGTDDNWTNAANWGGTSASSANDTSAFFGGTVRLTPVVDTHTPWALNTLFFNTDAAAFTLSGNRLAFRGTAGEPLRNNSPNTQTINNDLDLKGQITASKGDLVLNGNVAVTAGIFVRGEKNVTFNGLISGSQSVGRTDSGTLTLANPNNTFSGSVSVSHGVLSTASIADGGQVCALGTGYSIHLGQGTWGPSDTGTLRYTGPTASTNRTIQMTSNDKYGNGAAGSGLSGRPTIEVTNPTTTLTFNGNFQYSSGSFAGIGWFLKGAGNGVINGNITTTDAGLTKQGTGTWTLNGTNTYHGKTTISQGTLQVSREENLGANPIDTTADQLTLNGGTLATTASFTLDDSNRGVTLGTSGGTLSVADGTTLTVANPITGTGALTKTGGGELTFSGNAANTYTGNTTIAEGTLTLTGSNRLGGGPNATITVGSGATFDVSGLSAYTLDSGKTLKGGGTIRGHLTIADGATHAPGTSPGIQTIQGDYTLATGSTLQVELNGDVPGSGYDQLIVDGQVTLAGSLDLQLDFAPGFGDVFTLLDNQSSYDIAGTFDGLAEGAVVTGTFGDALYQFILSYQGNDGNDVTMTSPLPEPSAMILVGLGTAVLLGVSRRRHRSKVQ